MTAWKIVTAKGFSCLSSSKLAMDINNHINEISSVLASKAFEVIPLGMMSSKGDYGEAEYVEALLLYGEPFQPERVEIIPTLSPMGLDRAARILYWIRMTEDKTFTPWEGLPEKHQEDERNTVRKILRAAFE